VPVLTFIRIQEFGRALSNSLTISDEKAKFVVNSLMNMRTTVKLVLNGFRVFYLNNLNSSYEEAGQYRYQELLNMPSR
jgi:hypothetical protein